MTDEYASRLMNYYFDNESTDDELRELFTYLAENAEGRSVFADMKRVNDMLMRTPEFEYPHSIDRALASLSMGNGAPPVTETLRQASLPSVLLSGFALFLVFMTLLVAVSRTSLLSPALDREQTMHALDQRAMMTNHSFNQ